MRLFIDLIYVSFERPRVLSRYIYICFVLASNFLFYFIFFRVTVLFLFTLSRLYIHYSFIFTSDLYSLKVWEFFCTEVTIYASIDLYVR